MKEYSLWKKKKESRERKKEKEESWGSVRFTFANAASDFGFFVSPTFASPQGPFPPILHALLRACPTWQIFFYRYLIDATTFSCFCPYLIGFVFFFFFIWLRCYLFRFFFFPVYEANDFDWSIKGSEWRGIRFESEFMVLNDNMITWNTANENVIAGVCGSGR